MVAARQQQIPLRRSARAGPGEMPYRTGLRPAAPPQVGSEPKVHDAACYLNGSKCRTSALDDRNLDTTACRPVTGSERGAAYDAALASGLGPSLALG